MKKELRPINIEKSESLEFRFFPTPEFLFGYRDLEINWCTELKKLTESSTVLNSTLVYDKAHKVLAQIGDQHHLHHYSDIYRTRIQIC